MLQGFDRVWEACEMQYARSWCKWLHPPLRQALRSLHDYPQHGVRVLSFELFDDEGQLVAGEIGSAVGGYYTSLTGFSLKHRKSAGTVQLLCTGKLLQRAGFRWWDLGMEHGYKLALGAELVCRREYLSKLKLAALDPPCASFIERGSGTCTGAHEVIFGNGQAN